MDKKKKLRRQKTATREEIKEVAPRGVSFSTEEGRAAQGMRPDIGHGAPHEAAENTEEEEEDDEQAKHPGADSR